MRRTLTALVGLALLASGCGDDGDESDAAPAIIIDGETATADNAGDQSEEDAGDGLDSEGDGEAAADPGSTDATDEELALEFAQCMRDSGVPDFEDPVVNADGSIDLVAGGPGSIDVDDGDVQSAFDVCGSIIEGASFLPGADIDDQELEDNLLAMAECLRGLGNDVDDPDLSGGFGPGAGAGQLQSIFGPNFDPTDPGNADDIATCQTTVFGPGGAPGPGQGGN